MPKLYVMCGLSASGKSSIAKELAKKENCIIVSSDSIRGEICPKGVSDQSQNDKVFKIFHKRIKENLLNGKNVIADATNITIKSRSALLSNVKNVNCEKIICLTTKHYKDCIEDDKHREYPVGKYVIKKQMYSYQIPFYEEGWNRIVVFDNNSNKEIPCFESYLESKLIGYDQENPHHNETLFEHCKTVYDKFYDKSSERISYKDLLMYDNYLMGAFFHDLGKIFSKTYDSNGVAHYYNHENIGTYFLLSHFKECKKTFYPSEFYILENLFLINYHMMPFNWNTEKTHNKYKNIFGEFKYQMLLDFNECDKYRKNIRC